MQDFYFLAKRVPVEEVQNLGNGNSVTKPDLHIKNHPCNFVHCQNAKPFSPLVLCFSFVSFFSSRFSLRQSFFFSFLIRLERIFVSQISRVSHHGTWTELLTMDLQARVPELGKLEDLDNLCDSPSSAYPLLWTCSLFRTDHVERIVCHIIQSIMLATTATRCKFYLEPKVYRTSSNVISVSKPYELR